MRSKAIFLDRDGVISEVIMREGKPTAALGLEEFKFLPDIKKYLGQFKKMGFLNIIFTNQPDISRGFLKIEDLEKMHKIIIEELPIDEIKFCPHDDRDNCVCRKPKPGLILEAAKKWSIDLEKSYVIGDRLKDIEAGKAAGCKTILIRRSYNKDLKKYYDFEVKNLREAIKVIRNFS